MIGPTINKAGMSFSSFLLKVEGILIVAEKFPLEKFYFGFGEKRCFLFLNMGLESLLGFDSTLFTLNFDSDLALSTYVIFQF